MTKQRLAPVVPRERLADDPPVRTLVGLLANAATQFPDREFLRFAEGSWTFGDIDEWTSRLAHYLIDVEGVRAGDRVAIMLPNVVHWPVGWLAALKAGAVVVPINSSYREADLAFVLRDSGAKVVLTTSEKIPLFTGAEGVKIVDSTGADLATFRPDRPEVEIAPETLANLQYTSGTTGFPKACMLTHDYWVRLGWICSSGADVTPADVVLTAQPFSYIDPMWNTAMCLTSGTPLVVLPRFSASGFFADVRRHKATLFYVLGTMPTLLYQQPPSPEDLHNDVRLVLCSGIPKALHADLERRWGAPWREAYGMTESGVDLVTFVEDEACVGSGSMGRPVPTKRARVIDEEGNDLADGHVGELLVSGRPLMLGYWNRPDETAATLQDGWLHTGDLVIRDPDGGHRLVGRLKDMVRRGGENVSSAEVEGVLEQLDGVVTCAVIAVPDDLFGEEVKAFVQLADGVEATRATAERLAGEARQRLARFKVPRYIEFVAEFPKTPSERISKTALKERAVAAPGVTHDLRQKQA